MENEIIYLAGAAVTYLVSLACIIFSARKIKELRDKLRLQLKENDRLSDKIDYYENRLIPNLTKECEEMKKEATRLAASKAERDVDYLIKGLEYIIGKATPDR